MRALAIVSLAACSAPATLPELATAEARESSGDVDGAIAAYRAAQLSCTKLTPPRRSKQACAEALIGECEELDHADRSDQAIAAYLAVPEKAARIADPATAATALDRAGELLERAAKPDDAAKQWWRVVTEFPDEPVAADALKSLLEAARKSHADVFAAELDRIFGTLAHTQVADNILYARADLAAHELANLDAARALYDRIPREYPDSGLRDDARWYSAQISEQLGDWPGAAARLRGLLATREVSWMTGSYFSIWLDDAQLELGKVLRDHLHDLPAAVAAFRQLPKDYPASILRDDALYELEVTLLEAGDQRGACTALADLVKLEPDSKYIADAKARGSACK
ncbi:MAG TPA: tetratricopeptide repeat protein [Kofleriaceae bacterium]|jgi:tetratricopeptide (TPR) repeat protein